MADQDLLKQVFAYKTLLHKSSKMYKQLREAAHKINQDNLVKRCGKEWCKSKLHRYELLYLYQSSKGCCANCCCRVDKTFTVEHIKPKCDFPGRTWDISNMCVLCHSCNSKKAQNTQSV